MTTPPDNIKSNASPENERLLVKAAAQGNRDAFGELYRHYAPNFRIILTQMTRDADEAEELVQSAFLKIWEKREQLLLVESFSNYVLRVAKNHLYDLFRKKQIHLRAVEELGMRKYNGEGDVQEAYLYKQYFHTAQEAIENLPARRREVFFLKAEQGLGFTEIASKLGISHVMVKKHYYAAYHSILEHIRKNGEWIILIFYFFF